jgi:uncharacterized protein (UPF0332 family)
MFDGTEFLTLASDLLEDSADEARQRSAISRAYYAAFLRTRECLIARGYRMRHRETHQGVWNRMRQTQDPVAQEIGFDGMRLQTWRRGADYDIVYPGDLAEDAVQAVATAQTLLANLASLS